MSWLSHFAAPVCWPSWRRVRRLGAAIAVCAAATPAAAEPLERPAQDAPVQLDRSPEKRGTQPDLPAQTGWPRDPGWTLLRQPGLGTTMDFPAAVLSAPRGGAPNGKGLRYETPDGRARVSVWTEPNSLNDTPEGYLRKTFDIPRAARDYERITSEFFAVSGDSGDRTYYLRCNLSAFAFRCFNLTYPRGEKAKWDTIVTRMSRTLRASGE
jgi:hypothetical protein